MKGVALTHKGIEKITGLEINELINAKTETKATAVIFDFSNFKDLCLLCYKAQSVKRILYLLTLFKITDFFTQLMEKLSKINYAPLINKKTSFKVICEKIESGLNNEEIMKRSGEIIIEVVKKTNGFKPKVNLENPKIIFYVYIYKNQCYIGIDFSGRDLSKRDYKIFISNVSIKGTIAYTLLRLGNFSAEETLVDLFCKSGEIIIEAGLYASKFPINYYSKENFAFYNLPFFKEDIKNLFEEQDKKICKPKTIIYGYDANQKYVMQAKKNAKIAGVQKYMSITKQDIEWIDLKQREKSIDKIITYPPILSKIKSENKIVRIYKEFFYQAEYVLKDNGLVVVLSKSLELLEEQAKKYHFKLKDKKEIWTGKQKMFIGIFCKEIK